MSVVTVAKNTYTAEPLYQWDKDQVLEVYGLSLASIPEVHFCHVDMSRAIVRQATMDAAGVIRVEVPNSLLQKPYKLQAFICTYEGRTFQTLYKIEIPVKERAKPADYALEDDPEVYSFNALENMVVNVLADAEELKADAWAAQAAAEAARDRAVAAEATVTSSTAAAANSANAAAAAQTNATVSAAAAADSATAAADSATAAANSETAAKSAQSGAETAQSGAVAAQAAAAASAETVESTAAALNESLTHMARVAFGSYTGNGKVGSSNPNSLSFDFPVKAIFLLAIGATPPYVDGVYPSNSFDRLPVAALTTSYKSGFGLGGKDTGDTLYAKRSSDYKTVYWYTSGTSAANQANASGTVYYYMAIG